MVRGSDGRREWEVLSSRTGSSHGRQSWTVFTRRLAFFASVTKDLEFLRVNRAGCR